MTVRLSTGVRNALAQGAGLARMFNRGSAQIYSGSQPVSADAAVTGTLLGIVTASSGALTQETIATGTITLATGAAGSVNTVTVGGLNIIPDGAVPFNTSLSQTASDLADAINRNGLFRATVAGAVVTIFPWGGSGTAFNSAVVTSTLTTITASYANMASGVAPVNGLLFSQPSAGVLSRSASQVWSFNGVAAGTAGWFRLIASASDAGGLVSGAPWPLRIDGSIATSGADLNLSNIAITVSAPATIDTFNITVPA